MNRKRVTCPFCEGDGCCFCDHEGQVYIGPDELIKSEDGLNSIGVQYLKAADPDEIWYDLWAHFLDEANVPADFKAKVAGVEPDPSWRQQQNLALLDNLLKRL